MKKLLSILFILALSFTSAFLFVGCFGDDKGKHQHTYSAEYSYDSQYHWFDNTCGCENAVKDKDEHDFVNDICRDCKFFRYEGMLKYKLVKTYYQDKYYTVEGPYSATKMKNVVIPDTYEGIPVTRIADGAFAGAEVESVTLGANIITIGDFAFKGNSNLKSVTINENCEYLGSSCFKDCTGLESITIPSSLETICENAFENCTSLTEINLPSSLRTIKERVFKGCSNLKTVNFAGAPIDFYGVFEGCDGIERIELPEGLSYIGYNAFKNTTNLVELTIPASVTSIRDGAFLGTNNNLKVKYKGSLADYAKITFETETATPTYSAIIEINGQTVTKIDSFVTTISDYAFYNYDLLTSISEGENLTSIGAYAFMNCDGLKNIMTHNKLETIEEKAFFGCPIEEIKISASVKNIEAQAFDRLTKLINIIVDSNNQNYTAIDGNLYSKDMTEFIQYAIGKTQTTFTMPASVTNIRKNSFAGENELEELTIPFIGQTIDGAENTHIGYMFGAQTYEENHNFVPDSLKTIYISGKSTLHENCLYGLKNLTTITFDKVTKIENYFLMGCTGIKKLTIPDTVSVENLGIHAIDGVDSLEEITFYILGDKKYKISNTVKKITILSGENLYTDSIAWSYESLEEIVLPNSLKTIQAKAFRNFANLKTIKIPESVTYIGIGAFENCIGLTEMVLPAGVTGLSGSLFNGCDKLTSLRVKGAITYIGYRALSCQTLEDVVFDDLSLLETIGEMAFYRCKIKELHLTDSVKEIGIKAFDLSGIETLTIPFLGKDVNTAPGYGNDSESLVCDFIPSLVSDLTILGGKIQREAFAGGFSRIKKLTLGEKITRLNNKAFKGLSGLEEVYFKNFENVVIQDDVFLDCEALKKVNVESLENWFNLKFESAKSNPLYYAKNLYLNNELITNLIVPEGVVIFNNNALINCESLIKITLHENFIGNNNGAIEGCVNLEYNEYGNLLYLGTCNNDYYLIVKPSELNHKHITLHEDTKHIMAQAFLDVDKYIYVDVSDISTWMKLDLTDCQQHNSTPFREGTKMFVDGVEINEIVVPEGIETIFEGFLTNISTITKVVLSEGVVNINENAFNNASGLKEIYLSSTLKVVGKNAFEGAESLEKIIVTNEQWWLNLEFANISSNPFSASDNLKLYVGNNLLTEFTISNENYQIKQYAFANVKSLSKIYIPKTINSFGKNAFINCLVDVYITDADAWATCNFENAESNPINKSGNVYLNDVKLIDLSLQLATEIKTYAFYNCKNIETVVAGSQLKKVGDYAFYNNTALKSVDAGNVETIGSYAFAECVSLSSIDIEGAIKIYAYALLNCDIFAESDETTVKLISNHNYTKGYWECRNSQNNQLVKSFLGHYDGTGKDFISFMVWDFPKQGYYASCNWVWVER